MPAWVGSLGADEMGRRIVRELAGEGVDTRFIRTAPDAKTGFMLRDHRTAEFTTVDYYRTGLVGSFCAPTTSTPRSTGSARRPPAISPGSPPFSSASCRAAVHHAVERAERCGATVSFDVNYRRALATPEQAAGDARELTSHADIVFVGDDELQLLTDETAPAAAIRAIAAGGPSEVILKRGSDGACAWHGDDEIASTTALPVTVADVIGAGDSFVAGYLAARCHGLGIVERLRWATVCAACTVGTHGDWEGLPSRSELAVRARVAHTLR